MVKPINREIKQVGHDVERGRLSLAEAVWYLIHVIEAELDSVNDLDERVRLERKYWRKVFHRLLESTNI